MSQSRAAGSNTAGGDLRDPFAIIDGADWLLNAPERIPALWGDGNQVLWAQGEPLMIAGAPGVGKSTLMQQLVLARLGLGENTLLNFTVEKAPTVLYLALDRAFQIQRSMARMVTRDKHPDHSPTRRALESLKIVQALDFDPLSDLGGLQRLCERVGASCVVIDSLYDVIPKLTDDESVHKFRQASLRPCLVAGIDVAIVHHLTKGEGLNVYGSIFLQAMVGSLLVIDGEASDVEVKLSQAKSPAEPVGPLDLTHDHELGKTTAVHRPTVDDVLADGGVHRVTEINERVHGDLEGSQKKSAEARVRRRVLKLVDKGLVNEVKTGAYQCVPVRVLGTEKVRTSTDPANTGDSGGTHKYALAEGVQGTAPLRGEPFVPAPAPEEKSSKTEVPEQRPGESLDAFALRLDALDGHCTLTPALSPDLREAA